MRAFRVSPRAVQRRTGFGDDPLAIHAAHYSAAGVPRHGSAPADTGHRAVPDTSLVYVLSLADFFRTASTIGERDGTQVEMVLFAGGVYFVISLSASLLVSWLKKRTV